MRISYATRDGEHWTSELTVVARPPLVAKRVLTVRYEQRCIGVAGETRKMLVHLGKTKNPYYEVPMGPFDVTFDLAPAGAMTEAKSPALDDDYQSTFARNIGFLFPPLPRTAIETGAQWSGRMSLHLPSPKHMGFGLGSLPRSIPVNGNCTYVGRDEKGRARISVVLSLQDDKAIQVLLRGEYLFDVDRCRIVSGFVEGKFKVKKLFFWISIPMRVAIKEVDRDASTESKATSVSEVLGYKGLDGDSSGK